MRMAARNHIRRNKSRIAPSVKPAGFVRHTITLPPDVSTYFMGRKDEPEFAGNASSYARSLVIAERARRATKKAA